MLKVSIIVPVYNVEKYLRDCLNSIVNQTFTDIEVICVDDGSTDNSLNILKEYANKDNRFVILQQENQGAACARNYGLKVSNGEYLLFLDSDDVFSSELVEKTFLKAELYDVDIVAYKAISFNSLTYKYAELNDSISKFSRYQNTVFSVDDVPDEIFNSFLISAWNKLFKREFLLKNDISFQNIKRTNDLYFTNKALVLAKRIILLDEYLLFYRVGMQNNLQANNDKSPLAFYEALYALKYFLDLENLYLKVQKSFLNLALEVIFYNLNSIKTEEARDLVINKLKKEGFDFLGISAYEKLKELNFLGYLQYKAVTSNASKMNCRVLYGCYKLVQYYKLTGLKNTLRKVLLNR